MKTHIHPDMPKVRQETEMRKTGGWGLVNQSGPALSEGCSCWVSQLQLILVAPYDIPVLSGLLTFFNRSQESGFLCEIRFFLSPALNSREGREEEEREGQGEREKEQHHVKAYPKATCHQSGVVAPCVETSRTESVEAPGSNTASPWKRSPGFIITTLGSRGL